MSQIMKDLSGIGRSPDSAVVEGLALGGEVDDLHKDNAVVLVEGHGETVAEDLDEAFVGQHESFALNGKEDGLEMVDRLVGPFDLVCDVGFEPDEGIFKVGFDQDVPIRGGKGDGREIGSAVLLQVVLDTVADGVCCIKTHECVISMDKIFS